MNIQFLLFFNFFRYYLAFSGFMIMICFNMFMAIICEAIDDDYDEQFEKHAGTSLSCIFIFILGFLSIFPIRLELNATSQST